MIFKILGLLLIIVLIGGVFIIYGGNKTYNSSEYSGPVPEGYDEEHFRKTGETIPILNYEVNE